MQHNISYTMPGKDDLITVRPRGFGQQQIRLRRHYMNMYIREAYAIFLQTLDEGERCSLDWFRKQRPDNVLLLAQTPLDQCNCIIHTNFQLKLDALGKTYASAIWDSLLCDSSANSKCWVGECVDCSMGQKLVIDKDLTAMVNYAQWRWIFVKEEEE